MEDSVIVAVEHTVQGVLWMNVAITAGWAEKAQFLMVSSACEGIQVGLSLL